jgi:hypothetical protein
MMLSWRQWLVVSVVAFPLTATTLERLSVDDLITKSTAIVRARVSGSAGEWKDGLISTRYELQITEVWKGPAATEASVFVPGGLARGLRQTVPGSPVLENGQEYVFFLWTGKSGRTQIIGLSQGLFYLRRLADGSLQLERPGVKEMMVDPQTGRPAHDEGLVLRMSEIRQRIQSKLEALTH